MEICIQSFATSSCRLLIPNAANLKAPEQHHKNEQGYWDLWSGVYLIIN